MKNDTAHLEDAELMCCIAAGDKRAFETLLDRHLGRAVRTALRIMGNKADAEDIAQEAFTKVWLHAGTWKSPAQGGAKFTTWFHRIIVNLCIDHKRRQRSTALDDTPEPVSEDADGYDVVHRQQQAAAVAAALAQLPERQRIAITLCFYEELSNKEAADIMGISVKALESLLVRGRRTLREILDSRSPGIREAAS